MQMLVLSKRKIMRMIVIHANASLEKEMTGIIVMQMLVLRKRRVMVM